MTPSSPQPSAIPAGFLSVGYVTKAQGLKGEVIVHLTTNRTERLDPGVTLFAKRGPLHVVRSAPHGDRWRVQFEGAGDRNAAEALRGVELFAEPIDDPLALWVHDLVGSTVQLADRTVIGVVEAVEANPASDLLVLDGGQLVPLVFVVSSTGGVITIEPPEGLFDLAE